MALDDLQGQEAQTLEDLPRGARVTISKAPAADETQVAENTAPTGGWYDLQGRDVLSDAQPPAQQPSSASGLNPNGRWRGADGSTISGAELEREEQDQGPVSSFDPRGLIPFIQERANYYGIDPEIAVRVASSEGLRNPVGDGGLSGGAFQLYTGGGLGNEFIRDTGLDPLDPRNERATIDYALMRAAQGGWGPWHGASRVGVGEFDGIGTGARARTIQQQQQPQPPQPQQPGQRPVESFWTPAPMPMVQAAPQGATTEQMVQFPRSSLAPSAADDKDLYERRFDMRHGAGTTGPMAFLASVGGGFNQSLAEMLGIPGNALDVGKRLLAAGGWHAPMPWANPNVHVFPTGRDIKEEARKAGVHLGPWDNSGWSTVGNAVGSTIGASLPFIGVGAKAAWPEFLGTMNRAAGQSMPGYVGKQVFEAGAAGLGAGEAEEIYNAAQGSQGTEEGRNAAGTIGGMALSARLPFIDVLGRGGMNLAAKAYQMGKRALGRSIDPASLASMSPDQARSVVNDALFNRLDEALTNAKMRVAEAGDPRHPSLRGMEGAALQTKASEIVHSELMGFLADGAATERAIWSKVNPDLPRDYSATKRFVEDLGTDFAKQSNRDPRDFPRDIARLFEDRPENGTQGLNAADTLQSGQNIHSRIQQAIREEAAADVPNRARIGFLKQIDNRLLDDIGAGVEGGSEKEVEAYRAAMAYSRGFAQIRNSNELFDAVARDRSGAARIGAAETLDQFVASGQAGVTAAKALQAAAAIRKGGGGDMLTAAQDALRDRFVRDVAPQGYVSQDAYQQFVKKYGGLLSQEPFKPLAQDFNRAARGEQDVLETLGLGGRTRYYNTGSTAAQARQDRADLFLDAPLETVMAGLLRTPNQERAANAVIAQLRRDTTGQATEGFKYAIGDLAANHKGGGFVNLGDWAQKNQGLIRAMDKLDPGFAQRVAALSSITSKAGAGSWLRGLAASYIGAHGLETLLSGHLKMGSSMVMAQAGSRAMHQIFEKMGAASQLKLQGAMIADQRVYDAAVRAAGGKGTPTDFSLIHPYIPGLALAGGTGALGAEPGQEEPAQTPAPTLRGQIPLAK